MRTAIEGPEWQHGNLANADAAQNIGWNAGSSYLLPVSIIGPRIMRFGVKFDW